MTQDTERKEAWEVQKESAKKALMMAYAKHVLDDDSIGWDELGDALRDSLCELIGDKGFQHFIKVRHDN